jgi:hypothetical protein
MIWWLEPPDQPYDLWFRANVTDNGNPPSSEDPYDTVSYSYYSERPECGPPQTGSPLAMDEDSFPAGYGDAFDLIGGNIVVHDAPSKNQCKHGGFASFGFRNQGVCVASVERRLALNR